MHYIHNTHRSMNILTNHMRPFLPVLRNLELPFPVYGDSQLSCPDMNSVIAKIDAHQATQTRPGQ